MINYPSEDFIHQMNIDGEEYVFVAYSKSKKEAKTWAEQYKEDEKNKFIPTIIKYRIIPGHQFGKKLYKIYINEHNLRSW